MAKQAADDWATLEFTGTGSGTQTMSKGGRIYKFSATRNFVAVHPDDVEWMVSNGRFRKVAKPSVPPKAETFSAEVKTVTKIDDAPKVIVPKETANDAKAVKRSGK